VYAIPLLPLYVSTSLLFPYVTGRNFAFRILIELLLVPSAALVWLTRTQRRSPSPTTVALLVFALWIALADALGANPYRSVWSTLLVSVAAFADWRARVAPAPDVVAEKSKAPVRRPLATWIAAGVTAIVIVPAVYVLNLRPLFLAHDVVAALNAWQGGRLEETGARFERAFGYRGLRSQEAIEQMAALVPQVVAMRAATEPEEARRFVDRAIRELRALTALPAVEARHLQILGGVYTSASVLEPSYRPLALDSFNRALAISPNNEQIYVGLSNFHAAGGDVEQALAMMRTAVNLAPNESELQMRLAPLALRTGKPADAELETFRLYLAAEKNPGHLALGYLQTGDLEIAKIVLEEMRKRDPADQRILQQYNTVVEWLNEGRGAAPR
jgi:tetratricopeptide (TPR) repeat protein